MATLTLNSLPMELVETVINFLDFQDLCALRLTAHGISAKSSNGRFRQNLKSKKLHIAQAPLEDFAHFTQPGQVGCVLQHLTLSDFGVANESDKCLEAAKLLVQGMENLRQNTSHGGLVSLSLSLHEPIDSELEEAEHATAKLFDLVMLALGNSKLPVQIVDIFAKCFPIRCALACGEIMALMEKADLSSTFRECKELCLSLSHWLRDIDEHYESPLSFDQARDHTRLICDFVNMFPVLEELHLAWVYYDLAYTDAIQEEEHFFNRIANSCPFPLLKKCTFDNIRTTEAALLQFLKNVQLASLSMERVYLGGRFESIFHHLSTSQPNLEYLHLHQLVHDPSTVYFDVPHVPQYPRIRGRGNRRNLGPISLTRMGTDARRLVGIVNRHQRQ